SVFRCRGHPFFAQPQFLPALRAGRNAKLRTAIDGGHFDARAQSRLPCSHRDGHVDVVAIAAKHRMLSDTNDDEEIAGRPTVGAGVALAGDANTLAVARTGFHAHLERLGPLHQAFAMTHRADALRFSRAAAPRTGGVELHAAAGLRGVATAPAIRACA